MSAEPSNRAQPQPSFIATAPARALLSPLEQGLGARAPLLLLTGDAGTGKSMLAAEAVLRWGERATPVELPSPAPDPAALARALLELFGGRAKSGASAPAVAEKLMAALANATAGGRVAVLIADDAHELSTAQLLELHRLAEAAAQRQCPLEVLLVGLPVLEQKLNETALAAVRPRIAVRGRLATLTPSDTREYLQHRRVAADGAGVFSRKASRDIHAASLGVLRTIEALAAESLRRAQRAGVTTVSPEHVRAAAKALRASRPSDSARTLPPRLTVVQDRAAAPAAAPDAAAPAPTPAADAREVAAKPAPRQVVPPMLRIATPPPPAPPDGPILERVPPSVRPEAACALPEPEFPASNDPRVREWVARFGGSGVQIGAATGGRKFTEAELREDSLGAEAASLAGTSAAVSPGDGVSGVAVLAEGAGERGGRHAHRHGALPRPAARRINLPKLPIGPLAGIGLLVTLAAIAIAQHQAIGKLASATFANVTVRPVQPAQADPVAATPAPAAAAVTPAAPAPELPQQYSIAVGYYPTRDMATAEADYLSRLVPLRVRVSSAGRGTHAYRLLIGRFADADDAELAIERLQGNGLIPDARVVTAPPQPATSGTSGGGSPAPARHSGRRHSRR